MFGIYSGEHTAGLTRNHRRKGGWIAVVGLCGSSYLLRIAAVLSDWERGSMRIGLTSPHEQLPHPLPSLLRPLGHAPLCATQTHPTHFLWPTGTQAATPPTAFTTSAIAPSVVQVPGLHAHIEEVSKSSSAINNNIIDAHNIITLFSIVCSPLPSPIALVRSPAASKLPVHVFRIGTSGGASATSAIAGVSVVQQLSAHTSSEEETR